MEMPDPRDVLARLPGPVAVLSAPAPGGYRGLTATSFTSLSLQPPRLLVCLERWAQVRGAVAEGGAFNVSVLARAQEFLAERFGGRAPQVDPGWAQVAHRLGANGLPILEGCAAWFECRLDELRPAGDHDIAIGAIVAWGRSSEEPLIRWDGDFWSLCR